MLILHTCPRPARISKAHERAHRMGRRRRFAQICSLTFETRCPTNLPSYPAPRLTPATNPQAIRAVTLLRLRGP